jgi:uridine kinase
MYIIGIAGGSGSGKTTFTKKVLDRSLSSEVATLHQDSYYLENPTTKHNVHGSINFDHPDAFDWNLLVSHIEQLRQGKSVEVPIYDYKQNKRLAETTTLGPCKVVLFEGIFALWDEDLRNHLDLKVFLHVDADIRFIRRMHRDVRERGRTLDAIIRQYYDTVRPMHRQFLEPTRQYADITVSEETDSAADVLASHVAQKIIKLIKKGTN